MHLAFLIGHSEQNESTCARNSAKVTESKCLYYILHFRFIWMHVCCVYLVPYLISISVLSYAIFISFKTYWGHLYSKCFLTKTKPILYINQFYSSVQLITKNSLQICCTFHLIFSIISILFQMQSLPKLLNSNKGIYVKTTTKKTPNAYNLLFSLFYSELQNWSFRIQNRQPIPVSLRFRLESLN